MLQDIKNITKIVIEECILNNKKTQLSRDVYDLYRALEIATSSIPVNNCIAIDFENFTEETSHGTQADKWRWKLNKSLLQLNTNIKLYLHILAKVSLQNPSIDTNGLVCKLYKQKAFHSFVRDKYSVGFIEQDRFFIISDVLSISNLSDDTFYKNECNKYDLTTYEQRVILEDELSKTQDILKVRLEKLKKYIYRNYTVENLVENTRKL